MTTPKSTEHATMAVTETMAQLQKMGLNSMTWMGSDWTERMTDLGNEFLQFMAERVQKDVDLQHKLLHCKDIGELHEVQAEFVQTAIDRYTEETGRIIEMTSSAWFPKADAK